MRNVSMKGRFVMKIQHGEETIEFTIQYGKRKSTKIYIDEIGFVTSGGYSPTLKKTIGLGLVKKQYKEVGTEIEIEIRNKLLKGEIVTTPFYRNV